jgi:hypothetical protein
MAAISYVIAVGGNLETVTAGTNAPSSGSVELRFDQTTNAVTDGSLPGGSRALKRGEVHYLIKVLEQYLLRDTNVAQ